MKKIEVIAIGSKWGVVENGEVLHEFHSRTTAELAAHSLATVGSLNENIDGGKGRWDTKEQTL